MKRDANNPRPIMLLAGAMALTGVVPFRYALDTPTPPDPASPPRKLAVPSAPARGKRKLSRAQRKRAKAKQRRHAT